MPPIDSRPHSTKQERKENFAKTTETQELESDIGSWAWFSQLENRVPAISGAALMEKEFAPSNYVVRGLLPMGLSILGGAPKIGKFWLHHRGCPGSLFVLDKSGRLEDVATVTCTGRDIPGRELELRFDKTACVWTKVSDSLEAEMQLPPQMHALLQFMMEIGHFSGTNTELAERMNMRC